MLAWAQERSRSRIRKVSLPTSSACEMSASRSSSPAWSIATTVPGDVNVCTRCGRGWRDAAKCGLDWCEGCMEEEEEKEQEVEQEDVRMVVDEREPEELFEELARMVQLGAEEEAEEEEAEEEAGEEEVGIIILLYL